MKNDFFSRKLTQSQYRAGSSSVESEPVFLDLSLSSLNIKKEAVKEGIREKIREHTQSMVSYLLDEKYHSQVRQSDYLNKIFTQLDV